MHTAPIQYDTDTWLIMRDHPTRPKAVIRRVTDRTQVEKYLLMTWDPDPAKWRLHNLYETLEQADKVVLWDNSAAVNSMRGSPGYPAGFSQSDGTN